MAERDAGYVDNGSSPLDSVGRTAAFWGRATHIYLAYKAAQLRAGLEKLQGHSDEAIKADVWEPQHAWAGEKMHELCVSLRGFYLKARPQHRTWMDFTVALHSYIYHGLSGSRDFDKHCCVAGNCDERLWPCSACCLSFLHAQHQGEVCP